jgi:putative N6-adenine-specific DNA methylase
VDPLCGSGTFSLEAAMMAKRMAPGVKRAFAFMDWPAFREGQWAFLKREAQAQVRALDRPLIFASDIDADACKRLSAMVGGNGLSDAVRVAQKDVFQCEADQYGGGHGLVAINPPYGVRIGSTRQADDLFRDICRHLANRFKGWKVALIAPRQALASRLPFPARRLPLYHGGLRLTLVLGNIK